MSKMNNKGIFSKFVSSKGFYAALALCLVGASAATWVAVNQTITGIENANSQLLQNDAQIPDYPSWGEPADNSVADVPKEYPLPSSSSSPEPEPVQPSDEQPEQQDTQPASTTQRTLAYVLPARGQIIHEFSGGELVKNVTLNDWRTHDGVDIAAEKGEDIYAVADGIVSNIEYSPLWGTVVTILHPDGHESIYCGLSGSLAVAVADNVLARQVIGTLDGVPCEVNDEMHLHFAMKKDGQWVDPLAVIAKVEE